MSNLNIEKRDCKIANSAKKSRKSGKVPGVFYGKEIGNLMFEVSELDLNREVSEAGEHGILSFSLDNEEKTALIKEVQRDPVTHKIMHIDINEIKNDGNIQTDVQIQYVGEEMLAKRATVLQKEKDSVKITCKLKDLPKSIKMDISKGIPGEVFKYADLELGEELCIIDSLETVIASISNEKKIASSVEEVDE
ncbi:MAG: 50S ribosomal protein L25 [Clostridium sp.]